mmetsp:Transcript_56649/g.183515  ORF Transcript_56649/g.183515 Transcript_56649/m.183515 type:complete len:254 (+) Transcript_56649:837-1598(+)
MSAISCLAIESLGRLPSRCNIFSKQTTWASPTSPPRPHSADLWNSTGLQNVALAATLGKPKLFVWKICCIYLVTAQGFRLQGKKSPTYVRGKPFFLSSTTCFWQSEMPSRGFFSMARACKGMSGRDHASWAGERSSVLVSPVTLKTHIEIFLGTSGREVNHSASAQLFITCSAYLFPFFIFSSTSYLDSNIKIVLESASAAIGATAGSSRAATRGATLYPPIILPNISVAAALVMRGDVASPLTMAARKPAFT